MEFEQVFMFYLPRICEHCLNPSCVASCPSGAMYKRSEDGIVLVDQDRCRGWRFCVSGCPYKKVYFNHRTGKAEKCTLCVPRIEAGEPTICSETCVGRLRYLGLVLYDADLVLAAAATSDPQDLYEAQTSVFLDPDDPVVQAEAARQGIPADWIDAARRSPVHELAVRHRVALPLHPEYRTLPMVWYIPPLSPVADIVHAAGYDEADPDRVFATIDALRIPLEYLANLFTAGKVDTVRTVLRKLAAVRAIMRAGQLGLDVDEGLPASVGTSAADLDDLYRLLAIAKYEDRYVIPPAHAEDAGRLMAQHEQLFCSLDTEAGPGMGGAGPPPSVESFHPAGQPGGSHVFQGDDGRKRFNLLGHGYDYRTTVAPWFRGLFTGQPDVSAIAGAPIIYQVHATAAWVILGVWPFSRLVHAWSYPLWYLWRPYIVYRSRRAAPPAEPGTGGRKWRKIGVPY
jgi:nitrate reductase beta subunit